ncbi:Aromatic compound catabolic protein (fragment) [Pseudomonas sp. 8Z]
MEVFEAIFAGHFPLAPIRASRDFIPNHMTPSFAILQGRAQRGQYNSRGTVHGGCFATLLDSRLRYEVHSPLPARPGYTTLKHGAPLSDRMPMVRAKGKVIRVGYKLATAKGRIFGPDGEPYAHVTAACLTFHHLVPINPAI